MLCHLLILAMDVVDIPIGTSCATCTIVVAKTESDTTKPIYGDSLTIFAMALLSNKYEGHCSLSCL